MVRLYLTVFLYCVCLEHEISERMGGGDELQTWCLPCDECHQQWPSQQSNCGIEPQLDYCVLKYPVLAENCPDVSSRISTAFLLTNDIKAAK